MLNDFSDSELNINDLDLDLKSMSLPDLDDLFPLPVSHEYVYALQVRASKQRLVAHEAPNFFPCKALNPTIVRRKWTQNVPKEITYNLLPGYVFLLSNERIEPQLLYGIDGMIRVLKYSDGSYALTDTDERVARWLAKYDGNIGISKAVRVGDRITIIDGPLKEQRGMIISVDKRKKRAKINLLFNNDNFAIWLDFDWFEEAK